MEVRKSDSEAAQRTVDELRTIAQSLDMRELSELKLPEVEAVLQLVAQVSPAGSLKGVLSSSRARLPQRHLYSAELTRYNVNFLMRQFERIKDTAVYGTFFAGPASIISGYQQLLKLTGHDLEQSFPEGYWQFYVDYALREDTARHANETHGFDTVLQRHGISLNRVDRVTAWVMAAIQTLHHYNDLLQNEWRERVYTATLRTITAKLPDRAKYARLYRQWERLRPYRRGPDVKPAQNYVSYRSHKFDEFLQQAMQDLPDASRRAWVFAVREAKARELPEYQRQMSILAYLESGLYGEQRVPIRLAEAHIGLIHEGRYFLIPICQPNSNLPAEITAVRSQVATILEKPETWRDISPISLEPWALVQRSYLPTLREKFRPAPLAELDTLRTTPILINTERRPAHLELARIRQTERGMGTHAITIFDAGRTFVFDQSHIFFDGTWGAALAEIITNEATAWGVYLNTLPPIYPPSAVPRALQISLTPEEERALAAVPRARPEACAEIETINLHNLLALRRIFKLRSDLIQLTVNDLLVLYRAIHSFTYRPSASLVQELERLAREGGNKKRAAEAAMAILDVENAYNPAVLIPIDASQQNPRDRLHPMNFQVPIQELHLLDLHGQVVNALNTYKTDPSPSREESYTNFDQLQRNYLAALAGCGTVFTRAKEIAAIGESVSVGSIRLLAGLPTPLQRLLDRIPAKFEVLNDIIKGREVFSNIGQVVTNSSLSRFLSAKDDNAEKTLAWGILTDSEGVMRITLRDFRPHVALLYEVGQADLAMRITHDYLNSYASGLNDYVRDLRRVTMASRETRMVSDVGVLDVS